MIIYQLKDYRSELIDSMNYNLGKKGKQNKQITGKKCKRNAITLQISSSTIYPCPFFSIPGQPFLNSDNQKVSIKPRIKLHRFLLIPFLTPNLIK